MDNGGCNDEGQEKQLTGTTEAIYNVTGVIPEVSGERPGLHCSNTNDFCFFCMYESDPSSVGTDADLYGSLTSLVSRLTSLGREQACIAYHVRDAYDEQVRQHVPNTPEWTTASIVRHLTFSSSSTDLFDASTENMLKALIAHQNTTLIDKSTQLLIEENRRAFLDTVNTYVRYKTAMRNGSKRLKTSH